MSKLISVPLLTLVLSGCSNVNNTWCPPEKTAEMAPEPSVKQETLTLSADALFKFNQFTLSGLLPADREKLDTFVRKLKKNAEQIKSLTVVGHTDRLGSDTYNDTLGLKRAETVKTLLVNEGVTVPVSAESMGKRQPVTINCEGKGEALKACMQPDRRVDINVIYQ
ncbi:TPA: OmpA family protein [Vibrio cholerae]